VGRPPTTSTTSHPFPSPGRVAIVHERFTELGGSERVVEQLHALWPDAPVHTTVVDPAALPPGLVGADIRASALQRLYRGGGRYAHLLPLLPAAMRSVDLGAADLVICSHHAFANLVVPRPGVPVISYTHTPARWMWEPGMLADEVGGALGRTGLGAFARVRRPFDARAARRVTTIVANSHHVAERVRRWWGRTAEVVPPPVDVERFTRRPDVRREDFFLLAGRLVPYKRPQVAVAAAVRAGVRLVVAGDGRSRPAVEAAAGRGVELLGPVDDETLADLYRRCRALVFPGEEDFGIVPVEAQACGTPVLARGVGGVLDSVVDGVTGAFYGAGSPTEEVEALASAMAGFDDERFDPAAISAHARRFSQAAFRRRFRSVAERHLAPVVADHDLATSGRTAAVPEVAGAA
jgi:glycosyltransferase involved in cell wall biosynthesis